jgi:hypothetical protein
VPPHFFHNGPSRDEIIRVAEALQGELALRNIPVDVHEVIQGQALISVYHGLVAHTNGRFIWWTSPEPSRGGGILRTYARSPARAAARLAIHYEIVQSRPLAESTELPHSRSPADLVVARHALRV